MKENYESPTLEIYSFDVRDTIMDCTSDCPTYSAPCIPDSGCIVDLQISSL